MAEYITATLVNGQVLISELMGEIDENGFYTFNNPTKPIMMPESNKIVLVSLNPFSDSVEFKIHGSHVMVMGNLDATYIDVYNSAVEIIHKNIKMKYNKMLENTELDEYEDKFEGVEISQLIH